MGFQTRSTKLGRLKESITVKEAVVAVPYITNILAGKDITYSEARGPGIKTLGVSEQKKFISIPEERYDAAFRPTAAGTVSDSLDAAGASIRRQVDLMNTYILPPEVDFINNPDIDPLVMYMFEFEYTFDQDDLSYMWQNLAPKDYKQITLQSTEVSHELGDAELLSEENLEEGESLRWMIFKVKQRSQKDYYDFKTNRLGASETHELPTEAAGTSFNIMYNWPYDYLSFVEKIKIDAQVLFDAQGDEIAIGTSETMEGPAETDAGGGPLGAGIISIMGQYTDPPQVGSMLPESLAPPSSPAPATDIFAYGGPIYDPRTGNVISKCTRGHDTLGYASGVRPRGYPIATGTTEVLQGGPRGPTLSQDAVDFWKNNIDTAISTRNFQGFKYNKP